MAELAKVFGLIVFSGLKIFLAPSAIVIAGYGFLETLLISCTGGFISLIIFYKFGVYLQGVFAKYFKLKARRKFSKRNRWIVKIKRSYGFWGLAFLTPCLWGIPIGAVLASVFYPRKKGILFVFGLFIFLWSLLLTSISLYIKEI